LVQVTKKLGENESVLIFPGELVTVTDQHINHSKNTDYNIIAWKTKQITFKEESLNNVISALNKVYNSRISCSDSTILNQRFTSTFKDQTLDSVLSVICLAFDLKVVDDNGEIHVVQNNF
jgi:ferric-dicitrate binding protein FerR (iron transport regulator)